MLKVVMRLDNNVQHKVGDVFFKGQLEIFDFNQSAGSFVKRLYEIESDLSFYHTDVTHYILLRYVLIILSAFLVVSEYYDIATELFVLKKLKNKIEASGFYFFIFFAFSFLFKALLAVLSQITVCFIVVTSHLGQEKGIGLILNFTAGVIILEIDNLIVKGFVND